MPHVTKLPHFDRAWHVLHSCHMSEMQESSSKWLNYHFVPPSPDLLHYFFPPTTIVFKVFWPTIRRWGRWDLGSEAGHGDYHFRSAQLQTALLFMGNPCPKSPLCTWSRTVCVAVFHSWKLLHQSSTYQRDRRVTTVRKLPTTTTIVVGITALNLPIISWSSPFEAISGGPPTQSREQSAPQWPPSPALPVDRRPSLLYNIPSAFGSNSGRPRSPLSPPTTPMPSTSSKLAFFTTAHPWGAADHRTNWVLRPSLVSLSFARFRPPPATV